MDQQWIGQHTRMDQVIKGEGGVVPSHIDFVPSHTDFVSSHTDFAHQNGYIGASSSFSAHQN
jgi:hypothetical protein